uniref:Uncharacterized protein n=1 Tax=Glossina pallidipes TaxID=7398 RepID=A0A1B0A8L6_GLOPL
MKKHLLKYDVSKIGGCRTYYILLRDRFIEAIGVLYILMVALELVECTTKRLIAVSVLNESSNQDSTQLEKIVKILLKRENRSHNRRTNSGLLYHISTFSNFICIQYTAKQIYELACISAIPYVMLSIFEQLKSSELSIFSALSSVTLSTLVAKMSGTRLGLTFDFIILINSDSGIFFCKRKLRLLSKYSDLPFLFVIDLNNMIK